MIFAYDLAGGQQLKRAIPLYGAGANIKAGAAVARGVTAGTNQGMGIVAASTNNNFIGVTENLFAGATLDNDPNNGTKYLLTDVTINPLGVWEAEFNQTTGLTVASVAGGNPTVTSGEDISGGYLAVISGPAVGYLSYVKSVSAGAYTLKTPNTVITTASKVMKINQLYAPKADLTTDGTSILSTTAAQGSFLTRVLETKVVAVGFDHQFLDPTKHDGITFPTGFKFFAMIMFPTNIYNSTN